MSLATKFKELSKSLNIDQRHDVEHSQLTGYIQTQINEMRAVLTRLRVDVLLNQEIPVDGKQETEGRDKKIKELTNDIEQMVEAVNVLSELLGDLEK